MNKRITGYLNWKFYRKGEGGKATFDLLIQDLQQVQPDHIAVSGDIVNLSLESEFLQAYRRIRQIGSGEYISIIPGNHDAYIPGALARFCYTFSPWIGDGQESASVSRAFPYMRIRSRIAIIGISSALAMPPFFASGYFDRRQAQEIKKLLKKAHDLGLFRVVMIHHPPLYHATGWNKRLWGIERFRHIISDCGAELVLHGHTHLPTLSWIPGKDRDVPVVGVASASQVFGGHKPPAGYNIFEIDKNISGQWSCFLTRRSVLDSANTVGVSMQKNLFS